MINEIFEDRLAQFVFIFLIGIGIGTDLGNTVKHIKHPSWSAGLHRAPFLPVPLNRIR